MFLEVNQFMQELLQEDLSNRCSKALKSYKIEHAFVYTECGIFLSPIQAKHC